MRQFESVLDLGRKIADELGDELNQDTLSRWMGHYIAELVKSVENAPASNRAELSAQCCNEILKLWSHRSSLPGQMRPFQNFDSVFRVLESLDPDKGESMFFSFRSSVNIADGEPKEVKIWLQRACKIDDIARSLISYCIGKAAKLTLEKEQDWVKLANETSAKTEFDLLAINRILGYTRSKNKKSDEEIHKDTVLNLIERTAEFRNLARSIISDLRQTLSSEKNDQTDSE